MKVRATIYCPPPKGLEILGPPPTFDYDMDLEPGTPQHDSFMSMLAGEQGLLLTDARIHGMKEEVMVLNKNIVELSFPDATPER